MRFFSRQEVIKLHACACHWNSHFLTDSLFLRHENEIKMSQRNQKSILLSTFKSNRSKLLQKGNEQNILLHLYS